MATASEAIERGADPLASSGALPIGVLPSMNVMVSFAGGAGVTVAVNVTDWPKTEGVPDECSDVAVAVGPPVEIVTGWLF